jgi:cyclohexanecarboxyl-CoA dehydrogenase
VRADRLVRVPTRGEFLVDFAIDDDQRALVQTARAFAQKHLAPYYRQREEEGAVHRPTLKAMGELGLLGLELPESFGGLGLDCVTAGLVLEALCESDFNIGYIAVSTSLLGQILVEFGRPEIARPWVEALCRGEALPAIALTEPRGGSDAANLVVRARRDGDHYVLDGEKTSITLAAQADFTIVFARTGTPESRARGISAFLVPMDLPGIETTTFADHGGRSIGRGSIFFDGVRIPADHLLGDENQGFKQVMAGFDYSRALIGLQCLAVARKSLDETWRYTTERETFGAPLSQHQGVTFPLAEADTMVSAARLQCLQTLWLRDRGLPHTVEAAMCKWWAPKLSYDVVNTCLLSHGHGGYSSEYPFEQRMRDILGLQIGDGTAQIMKMIVARHRTAA